MICKFCREDLPAADFRLEDYHRAKTNLTFPTCVTCLGRGISSKKQKRKIVKEIMRKVHAPDRKRVWQYSDDIQKKQLQMVGRTKHEIKLDEAMTRAGLKFEPQFRLGPYWVDFGFASQRLAVEVDGSIHDDPKVAKNDAKRQSDIEERHGWMVMRFTNERIDHDLQAVVEAVASAVAERWEFGKLPTALVTPAQNIVYIPPSKSGPEVTGVAHE